MSPEILAAIGGTLFVTFSALIGIIYSNLRHEINNGAEERRTIKEELAEWREVDQKFKEDIIDRLARIETTLNGKK
ncbi:MAG: hypothetical protein ACXAB9_12980 [Candidatus Thorarchaeota archaeon]|jgi:hypothetical protein